VPTLRQVEDYGRGNDQCDCCSDADPSVMSNNDAPDKENKSAETERDYAAK
jgi:hypothetical protein